MIKSLKRRKEKQATLLIISHIRIRKMLKNPLIKKINIKRELNHNQRIKRMILKLLILLKNNRT